MFTIALFGLLKYSRETFVCVCVYIGMGRWPSLVLFEWLRKYLPIDRRIKKSTAIDRLPSWLRFRQSSESSPWEKTLQPYKELAGICVGGF